MTTGRFDAPVPAQRMVTYYWLLRISPEVLKNAVPVWSRFRVRLVWCKARATGPTEVWCSSVGVLARLSQFLTRNPRKWLILSIRYSANGLRLSPQIDFDRGRFGVVVALVKTSRDDGGSVEPAPRVE